MKGVSLPINSTAVLVLILMFVALFFAMVSGVVNTEVDRFLNFSEKNSPDDIVGTDFKYHKPERSPTNVDLQKQYNLQYNPHTESLLRS